MALDNAAAPEVDDWITPAANDGPDDWVTPDFKTPQPGMERAGILDTASRIGGQLLDTVTHHIPGGVASAIEGSEPGSAGEFADMLVKRSRERTKLSQQEAGPERPTSFPFVSTKDIAGLGGSMGGSLPATAAGLAAGLGAAAAATPLTTPAGGIVAGTAAGMAASGGVAYRSSVNQFTRDLRDAVDEDRQGQGLPPISADEFRAKKAAIDPLITEYGLWEALPEAAGNALGFGILKAPIKGAIGKVFGNNVLVRTGSKLGALYGTELATETVTEQGQHNTKVEASDGLSLPQTNTPRSWTSPSDLAESFKEVAGPTILQTTLMAGGVKGGMMLADRMRGQPQPGAAPGAPPAGPGPGETVDPVTGLILDANGIPTGALPASTLLPEAEDDVSINPTTQEGGNIDIAGPAPAENTTIPPNGAEAPAVVPESLREPDPAGAVEIEQPQLSPSGAAELQAFLDGKPPAAPASASDAPYAPDAEAPQRAPRSPSQVQQETGLPYVQAAEVAESEGWRAPGTKAAPVALESPQDVHAGAELTNPAPTPAQAESGIYQKRHVKWQGRDFSIETEQGAERVAADGSWRVTMPAPYGHILGTVGADGDPRDVYIGPDPKAPQVFVLDQIDPDSQKFDEHKAFVGFADEAAVRATYEAAFSDGSGSFRAGAITPMSIPQFKAWLKNGKPKAAVAYKPQPAPRAKSKKRGPISLIEFLAVRGIKDSGGELRSMGLHTKFVPGVGRLVRNNNPRAMSLDVAREAAVEAGYLQDEGWNTNQQATTTTNDLLTLLAQEASGTKVYSIRDEAEAAARANAAAIEESEQRQEWARAEVRDIAKAESISLTDAEVDEAAVAHLTSGRDLVDVILEIGERGTLPDLQDAVASEPQEQADDTARTVGDGQGNAPAGVEPAGPDRIAENEAPPVSDEAPGAQQPGSEPQPVRGPDVREPEAAVEPASPQPEPPAVSKPAAFVETPAEKKARIEDAGEKIGGARKDAWGDKGMSLDDLKKLSGAERAALLNKQAVWPRPDYAALVEGGLDATTAYLVKRMYDKIPSAPTRNRTAEQYVEAITALRKIISEVKNEADADGVYGRFTSEVDSDVADSISIKRGRYAYYSAGRVDWEDKRAAKKAVAEGWPTAEPWKRRYKVVEFYAKAPRKNWGIVKAGARELIKDGFDTREEAEAEAKSLYEKFGGKPADGPKEPARPHLDNVARTGPDYRNGADKSSEDFVKDFGFRGVEFGNWVAGDERQKTINLAYDALHDLARVMGLPPKAMSLNGTLGVGFGSRGKGGKFAAHYEPHLMVINMTKISGAGSLAHEWAHALDHYLGEVDSENAYGGAPKSISNWRDTSVTERTYTGAPLKNLSQRLGRASNAVMHALHFKEETDEQLATRAKETASRRSGGLESWQEEAERVRGLLRKGGNTPGFTRTLNARLRKAQEQIGIWTRSNARHAEAATKKMVVKTNFYKESVKISGSGDYWHRPNELFARSFESYVFDKIAAEGGSSQYLVQGVEDSRFEDGYKGNPYPAGDERAAINSIYDNFVKALEAVEGKRGADSKIVGKTQEDWVAPTVTDITPVKPVTDEQKVGQLEAEMKALDDTTSAMESGSLKVNRTSMLAAQFTERLLNGQGFASIVEARKLAAEVGFDGDNKSVEEAMELAMVAAARQTIAAADDQKHAYDALVYLYKLQPRLGTRTSTSMRDQAYSTPIPLAYIASRLARITAKDKVFEPSAGNGALLIEASTETAVVNEINPDRAANLKSQGFEPTTKDASEKAVAPAGSVDVVITNPPFGAVRQNDQSKVYDLSDIQSGYTTNEIDHAIALRSLAAMRKDGTAVLILGGLAKTMETAEARSDGYNSKAKREFYKTLYDRYNVVDHFTVAGDLYARQGAGWPVDVIVIDGAGKSKRALPAVDVPRVLASWEQIGGMLDDGAIPGRDGRAADRPADEGSGRGTVGPDGGVPTGGGTVSGGQSELGEPGDVQPGIGGRPANVEGDRPGESAGELSDVNEQSGGVGAESDTQRRPLGLDELNSLFDEALTAPTAPPQSADAALPEGFEILAPNQVPSWLDPELANPSSDWQVLSPGGFIVGAGRTREEALAGYEKWEAETAGTAGKDTKKTSPRASRSPRKTSKVAKAAATEAVEAADAAMTGLYELFGGGKTVGTLGAFDEATYEKAKVHFKAAAQKFSEFKNDIRELMKRLIAHLRDTLKWPTEALKKMQPYVVRFMQDVQSGAESLTTEKAKPAADRVVPAASKQEQETASQVKYQGRSGAPGFGTLAPVNISRSITDALDALEDRVGSIDAYVAKELGYSENELFSYLGGEQVDALALAIDNLTRGKGFIIGDQTGIGKGRVNAAIIRWAIQNDRIPIFVTEKPNLYKDMYRDLTETGIAEFLGKAPRILATNNNSNLRLTDDPDNTLALQTDGPKEHGALLAGLNADNFDKSYDMVFTTYNQLQTVATNETPRREFVTRIASNSVLIFDESHNAGGSGASTAAAGARSEYVRGLVNSANGVFYSSATYAKRPEVMDLYSATDMAMAVDNIDDLGEAISSGGVPMQQVVASMLAEAGQYIRRERSFSGITYATPEVAVDRDKYDGMSGALAAIKDFSDTTRIAVRNMDRELKSDARRVTPDGSTGGAGASSIKFTSVMHNVINQMLLAFKAKDAADRAIAALKSGQKPVITFANTMESMIDDLVEQDDIKQGGVIDADFSHVLNRYLKRSRTISIRKPFAKNGEKAEKHYLTDAELGFEGLAAYERAKETIEGLVISNLALSPIDQIKQHIIDAGYSVGEITGRGTTIDYSGEKPTLSSRGTAETSIQGRSATIFKFNNGNIDVLLFNQAGATGISLHASKTFKDQRQRHMILAQPEADINTHMQMLGRIHRTGQVVLPEYSQLVANIPAEKRPAAALSKKMASLSANTTGARGNALSSKDTPDFLNEYGDIVAATIVADDPVLHSRLGEPVSISEEGKIEVGEAMRKLTGRIPLLTLVEQEELYERLENDYAAYLEQMKAAGENALEAQSLDLKAKTIETTEVQGSKNDSGSVFASPVKVEKVNIARVGKPYSPKELIERLTDRLGVEKPEVAKDQDGRVLAKMLEDVASGYTPIGKKAASMERTARTEAEGRFAIYLRSIVDEIDDPARAATERTRLNAIKDRYSDIHRMVTVGARITLRLASGNLNAIVLKAEQTGEAKNPLALSTWKVTFAIADVARQITLPFSRLYMQDKSRSDDASAIELVSVGWSENATQTVSLFEALQTGSREDRYIATGNLLAAYEWLGMKGQIINYTDDQGTIRQGILTARAFDLEDHYSGKAKPIRNPADVIQWLRSHTGHGSRGVLWSQDKVVRLASNYGNLVITTESKRKTGGKYFLDVELTKLTQDFYKMGSTMTTEVSRVMDVANTSKLTAIIERLQALGAVFVDSEATALPKAVKAAERTAEDTETDDDTPRLAATSGTLALPGRPQWSLDADLTDRWAERAAKLQPILRAELDRLGLKDVNLTLADTVKFTAGGQAMGAKGLYFKAAITLALEQNGNDLLFVMHHEALHALKDMGAFTDAEWKLLTREAESKWRKQFEVDRKYRNDSEAVKNEEGVAWAYQSWLAGTLKVDGRFVRLFKRIQNILKALGNAMRGLGFQTAEDVFEKVKSGEVGARLNQEPRLAADGDLFSAETVDTPDGPREQLVIPGAEKITEKERVQRLADKPLAPKKAQKAAGSDDLFGEPDAQMPLFALNPTQPGQANQPAAAQGFLARGQMLDRVLRSPFKATGLLTPDNKLSPGVKLFQKAGNAIVRKKFDANGRMAWMNPAMEIARNGLIDRYNLRDLPDYEARERSIALDERAYQMRGAAILKTLENSHVGPAEAKVIRAMLTNETVTTPDMMALVEPIRVAIDQLGQEAVELGLISRDSYERNRGAYLHRVYLKHEADGYALMKWADKIMGSRRKKLIGDQLKGRGIFKDVTLARLMRDIPEWHAGARGTPSVGDKFIRLDEMPQQASAPATGPAPKEKPLRTVYWPENKPIPPQYSGFTNQGTWEVRRTKDGNITIWRDYTKQERSDMGEILDGRYAIAKTFSLMAHDLSVGRFYKDISENNDWARKTPPAEPWMDAVDWSKQNQRHWKTGDTKWVKVPNNEIPKTGGKKRWGALADMYVKEEIWRDLNHIDIMNTPNTWRALLTQWKLNKTVRSPTVHMNNVMSNFMLMDLIDVRGQDLIAGIFSYAKGDAHYEDARDHGAFGSDMITQEIRDDVLKPILEDLQKANGQIAIASRHGMIGQLSKIMELIAKGYGKADDFAKMAYRVEDEVFRMATYMRRVSLGDSPEQAARTAREQFIDYDIRAPWVTFARNTGLPFISYTYRIIPKLAEAVTTRPWKVAKYALLGYVANTLAYSLLGALGYGGDDEEKERGALRDQEQGKTWFGLPRMVRMPWNDDYGNPVFLDVRRWMPGGDLFDLTQGHQALAWLPPWLTPGGPMLLAVEFLANRQAFTGKPIVDEKLDTEMEKLEKVADWAWRSWMPNAPWIPNSWNWDKISNAIHGRVDKVDGNPYGVKHALASSVGIKVKPLDVDGGYESKGRDASITERYIESERSRLQRLNARGFSTEAQFEKQMENLDKKRQRLEEKTDKALAPNK